MELIESCCTGEKCALLKGDSDPFATLHCDVFVSNNAGTSRGMPEALKTILFNFEPQLRQEHTLRYSETLEP